MGVITSLCLKSNDNAKENIGPDFNKRKINIYENEIQNIIKEIDNELIKSLSYQNQTYINLYRPYLTKNIIKRLIKHYKKYNIQYYNNHIFLS